MGGCIGGRMGQCFGECIGEQIGTCTQSLGTSVLPGPGGCQVNCYLPGTIFLSGNSVYQGLVCIRD